MRVVYICVNCKETCNADVCLLWRRRLSACMAMHKVQDKREPAGLAGNCANRPLVVHQARRWW